ncbi:MAG: YIP1 family protein [Chitinophagaceae bacterium]|nr:YIP1 family protein [Chitinophagaceae bacterium]
MNLIERVKNILITPKTEWEVINKEAATPGSLFTGYVLPLAIFASLGTAIRYFLASGYMGTWGLKYMIASAVIAFIAVLLSFYLTALIVDMLAPTFNSEKNMGKSAQLVAYSGTPSYIGSFLSFIPIVGTLISVAAWAYGIYLMYLGIGPLKKTPEDKKVVYLIVAFIIMIASYFIITAIIGAIIFGVIGSVNLTGIGDS